MPIFKKESKTRRFINFIIFTSIGGLIALLMTAFLIYEKPSIGAKIIAFLGNNGKGSYKKNVSQNVSQSVIYSLGNVIKDTGIGQELNDKISNSCKWIPEKNTSSLIIKHVIASTNFGKIRGVRITEFGIPINQFLGVSFASPPIANLRFKPTVPLLVPWREAKDATQWPRLCFQPNYFKYLESLAHIHNKEMSEDCLYLNIWSPMIDEHPQNQSLPVMVFIHGGGFLSGGSSVEEYNGKTIAAVGNVIVVTIQYRLGAFGFLDAEHDAVPGNVGLSDQIMALRWIKENIHHFGGNSNQLTVFGESSGAISIGLMMAAPDGRGLFNRAILESGSPMMLNLAYNNGAKVYKKLITKIGCDNKDNNGQEINTDEVIKCLLQLPAQKIIDTQMEIMTPFAYFSPTIPTDLLPQYPNEAINEDADEELHQTEVLIGSNEDEGTLFLYLARQDLFPVKGTPKLKSMDEARELLVQLTDGFGFSEAERRTFARLALPDSDIPDTDPVNITRKLATIISNLAITCPSLKFAESLHQMNVSVYLYYFTERSSQSPWSQWVGVTHHDEVAFVFGLPLRYPHLYDGEEIELSKRMINMWTHFAKTGQMMPQKLQWPQYSPDKDLHMELNAKYSSIGNSLNANCFMFNMAYDSLSI